MYSVNVDKQDIMPDCVVRRWYPNPSVEPCMGHKWQKGE